MIDLYTWTTANGRKPLILLEELELPYRVVPVDLSQGQQHAPAFLQLNPNGKIPVLVDDAETEAPTVVFESGAILLHLAEKHGRFLDPAGPGRAAALSWLMFQMSAVGPIFGQLTWFMRSAPEPVPVALDHFRGEVLRILDVLDARLARSPHLAGEYGVADIATWPWINAVERGVPGVLASRPAVARWREAIAARPAVRRAMAVPIQPAG